MPSITLNMTAAKGFLREALTARQMRIEVRLQGWAGWDRMERRETKEAGRKERVELERVVLLPSLPSSIHSSRA